MYVSVSSLRGGLCRFGEAWAALVGLWAEKLLTYLLSPTTAFSTPSTSHR